MRWRTFALVVDDRSVYLSLFFSYARATTRHAESPFVNRLAGASYVPDIFFTVYDANGYASSMTYIYV